MKTTNNHHIAALAVAFTLLLAGFALAEVPKLLNYQGYLTDRGGTPTTDTLPMTFSLYDAESGGTLLWTETWGAVSVNEGVFNVLLGSVTTLDLDFSADYWLETTVNGELLAPRHRLVSVGYAFRAEYANSATETDPEFTAWDKSTGISITESQISDLSHTDSQTLSLASPDLSISGGNSVDLSGFLDNTDSQDLSLSGNTLSLTGDGTSVDLSGYLDNTDEQDLSLSGNTLSLTGDGTSVDLSSYLDDNLGDHTATENIKLSGKWLSNDGHDEGIYVDEDGNVGIGMSMPDEALHLDGDNFLQTPANPVLAGSLGLGGTPWAFFVSGRFVYVVDIDSGDFMVIDVSDPGAPKLVRSLAICTRPKSVYVAGRYAYVVDSESDDLKVIDVSDPYAPSVAGSLGIGGNPQALFVAGRYAYVLDTDPPDLKVIDVSDPSSPSLTGSLGVGNQANSVFVSGRYAYVADLGSGDLKVIDVSDPSAPSLAGSLGIDGARSVCVSGRYAYVLDSMSGELKVIDISNPSTPGLAGSLGIGSFPMSVFVSGRYAYVVDQGSDDLKVIDISDAGAPSLAGSLAIGGGPRSVFVAGRYAYVVDVSTDDLKVIDVSGAEIGSAVVHSLETGALQVRESLTAQGHLAVAGGVNIGAGGLFSDGNIGLSGTLAIANDIAPTSSPANLVQLYAEDDAGSSELKVRDEAGNVTTLSPHNFSLVGAPSEPLAWSFFSENEHGRINVDMLRTVRLVEKAFGEKLVHIESKDGSDVDGPRSDVNSLLQRIEELEREIERLKSSRARN